VKKPVTLQATIVSTALASVMLADCRPSPADSRPASVDALFAEWNRSDSPGCAVGISRNGIVRYEHAYGMASLELGVPITTESVFPVASISKQFTAMSVVLLADQHRLSLDDEVRKYIPELPDYGTPITIRQVLNHTSGLREGFILLGWAAPGDSREDPNEAVLRVLSRQRGLDFSPGTSFRYNNGGYNLLGSLVRRVSGQSLAAFADANIFKPLGMTHTHFHDDPDLVVRNRVSGYWRDDRGLHPGTEAPGVVGNAGLHSTVGDLLRWEQNLAEPKVGTPALIAEMQTPGALVDGSRTTYGFGLVVGDYRGQRVVHHGGGDRGISTWAVRYPDQGLSIAVLCNLDTIPTQSLAQQIADLYLSDASPPVPQQVLARTNALKAAGQGRRASVSDKTGLYREASTDAAMSIADRNGALVAHNYSGDDFDVELTPVNENVFRWPNSSVLVEFEPIPGGHDEMECRITNDGQVLERYQRTAFSPTARDLQALGGEYTSQELDVTYRLEGRDSGLVVKAPGRADISLQPLGRDMFAGSSVGTLKLLRDARGTVTGFTMNRFIVRGVRFERLKRAG
jgi:CubicO group peptidase (beta-lactamase class C family)